MLHKKKKSEILTCGLVSAWVSVHVKHLPYIISGLFTEKIHYNHGKTTSVPVHCTIFSRRLLI